jgi:hypothetical protein
MFKQLTSLSLLALFAATAQADFLTGQLVDSNGVPVAGADIDVKNNGSGGKPTLFNDGTDASGFFNVTIPNGDYDVIFNPPPPPFSMALTAKIKDVIVVGTKNMGVVTVPAGVAASGRVLTQAGLPVGGVNINAFDKTLGSSVDLLNDTTDAFGNFSLSVPSGEIAFRIDPTPAHADLAPVQLDLSLSADVNLGDIVMVPGFPISGILHGVGGAPLSGVDIDVFDASGKKLYTPSDNSQATGFFTVTAPAGNVEVAICPLTATRYVAETFAVAIAGAPTNLGVINMIKGKLVSGHVSSSLAPSEGGVNLDVTDSVTGIPLALCTDNTNGAGNYQVVVPTGTFDFKFDPFGYAQPLGATKLLGVVVAVDMTLDAVLQDCPFPALYGAGSAGTGGLVPQLSTIGGTARPGNLDFAYQLDQALPGSVAILALGFAPTSLPLFGGTLLVDPLSGPLYVFASTAAGSTPIALPVPIQGNWQGISIYAQAAVIDAGVASGLALSNGVSFTICD